MLSSLSNKELKRYDRHLILEKIGIVGQEKLKKAKVLVVGAGGLGAPVLQYLTAAGVGTIGIADKDVVEESNLQRQVIFAENNIGKLKTVTAKEKLKNQNSFVNFIIHNIYINKKIAEKIFSRYDIIVDCTDNIETRYLINDTCVTLNKPVVYGSVYKFEGQVSVFNYKGGPTYRCLFPETANRNAVKASSAGIFGAVPGIIGSVQASEVIKIITETGTILSGKLFCFDALNTKSYTINFKKVV